jgi:hypothetical protein
VSRFVGKVNVDAPTDGFAAWLWRDRESGSISKAQPRGVDTNSCQGSSQGAKGRVTQGRIWMQESNDPRPPGRPGGSQEKTDKKDISEPKKQVLVSVNLDEKDCEIVLDQQYEIMVYLDKQFYAEEE